MRTVAHKDTRPFMRREVGKPDGLSKNYFFDKSNKHTVEMTNADAAKLAESGNASEFSFADVESADDAIVIEDGEIV